MNKKVLTLCAGLLLSGSMFAANQAGVDWSKTPGALDNAGKYWQLNYLNYKSGSNDWAAASTGYYLTTNNNGELVAAKSTSNLLDESSYWTLKYLPLTAGENFPNNNCIARVQIENIDGYTLTLDKSTHEVADKDTKEEDKINTFYVTKSDNDNLIFAYFPVEGDNTTIYCLGQTGPTNSIVKIKGIKLSAENHAASWVIADIAEEVINAADLNAQNKNGFYLDFKGYDNLQGNVFTGKIQAIPADKVNGKPNDHAENYYLYKPETDEYIVLTKEVWGTPTDINLDGEDRSAYQGYKFDVVSEHTWKTKYATGTETKARNEAMFQILKSYDFNDTDSLIVTMPEAKIGKYDYEKGPNKECPGLRLYVSTVAKTSYLTVIEYDKANDRLAEQQNNAYPESTDAEGNKIPYEVGANAPYIQFGKESFAQKDVEDFAGKLWNITTVDGSMIMSPEVFDVADIDEIGGLFVPAKQVDLTNPEGQWLLNREDNNKDGEYEYYFVNRESGAKWYVNFDGNNVNGSWIVRTTGVDDVYEVSAHKHEMYEWQTIIIKEAGEPGLSEKGYVNFDMNEEANNGKYFSFSDSFGDNIYIGMDADENVVLTKDQDQAIEFRIKQLSHDFTDHDGEAAPDTLRHYTTYLDLDKDGKIVSNTDTLQFFQYALYENFSEKYLTYDDVNKNFKLSTWSPTNNGHEDFDLFGANNAFVVKEKEDGSYILVRNYAIDYDYCEVDGEKNHTVEPGWNAEGVTFDNIFEVNFGTNANLTDERRTEDIQKYPVYEDGAAHKVYAAYLPGTLADMEGIYNFEDNDRITMANTDKVEYMNITGAQDTVKIALQDQPNFFLYEQKGFLGMEHVADVEDMKAAIFVDTANVSDTYRPQYLLAMNGKHVEKVWDNHPSRPQDIPHLISQDTTYGRFLVNMVDSAVTYKGSDKTNPYIFDRNDYYRLAFIDGWYTTDTLYLNTANKTKIALDKNQDYVCTFAFRYVDNSRTGVKIETRYNTTADDVPVRGWLKYQNNVAVVTNDYNDAHVFTVDNTTLEAPTANEEITAEGAVSVVATDGAVIIKGAEGKNVVIATILGKVVANETVNSDNETIAVPAGIAVVSVDGESFKVVVK